MDIKIKCCRLSLSDTKVSISEGAKNKDNKRMNKDNKRMNKDNKRMKIFVTKPELNIIHLLYISCTSNLRKYHKFFSAKLYS